MLNQKAVEAALNNITGITYPVEILRKAAEEFVEEYELAVYRDSINLDLDYVAD